MENEPEPQEPQPTYEFAREIGLRLLTARARSRHELADGLARRGVPDPLIDQVVHRFQELGLIDDRSFAATQVETGRRRLRSKRALSFELKNKGVDPATAVEALEDFTPSDELTAARELAAKRLRSLAGLEPQVAYRRLAGVLARRGFPAAVVGSVVREALERLSQEAASTDLEG